MGPSEGRESLESAYPPKRRQFNTSRAIVYDRFPIKLTARDSDSVNQKQTLRIDPGCTSWVQGSLFSAHVLLSCVFNLKALKLGQRHRQARASFLLRGVRAALLGRAFFDTTLSNLVDCAESESAKMHHVPVEGKIGVKDTSSQNVKVLRPI